MLEVVVVILSIQLHVGGMWGTSFLSLEKKWFAEVFVPFLSSG